MVLKGHYIRTNYNNREYFTTEWKVHHDSVDPDVVILSNGHGFGFPNEATNYSSTVSMLKNAKLVGYDTDLNVKIIEGQSKGIKAATKTYKLQEAEEILKSHYAVSRKLKFLKKKVKHCEEILGEVEEELNMMKISKNALRHFHAQMDDLTPEEQEKSINIAPFLLDDVDTEQYGFQIPTMYPKSTATQLQRPAHSSTAVEESGVQEASAVTELEAGVEEIVMPEESAMSATSEITAPELTLASALSDQIEPLLESSIAVGTKFHQVSLLEVTNDENVKEVPTKKRKASSEPPVSTSKKVDIIEVILDGDSEVVLQERQSKKVKATFVDTASASTSSQSTAVSATVLTGAIKKKKAPPQLVSRKNREARGPHPTIGRDPKRFYCEQCLRHFAYEKGLKEHMAKRCGQTKKQFKCGYCYREFFSSETYQNHVAKEHLNLRRHICSVCGEGFFDRPSLLQHARMHQSLV